MGDAAPPGKDCDVVTTQDGGAGDRSRPEPTADGRYVVVDGRRWRASDPAIPAERAAELRSALSSSRSATRHAGTDDERAAARARTHAAKVALGERGTPWWEQTGAEREARWSDPAVRYPDVAAEQEQEQEPDQEQEQEQEQNPQP